MTIIHTIILGIVEGLTEFLPISSTAHLEIAQRFLGIATSDFVKSFEIAIQLGAILSVVFFYRRELFGASFLYVRNIIIAFIPTGVIGFLLYKIIKSFLLGNIFIVATTLLLGGLFIVIYEYITRNKIEENLDRKIENLSVKELLILGSAQALAAMPGVSRSGAVIISGRILGLPRTLITEFSFLLAIPTMFAAVSYDLLKTGVSFTGGNWANILLGMVVSFIVAFAVIKWFLTYIQKHSFAIFGWYRIILGLALLAIFL
jgi:undecaprenyl-diphosphatase